MEFERTTDMDLVRRIITNARVYPKCGDDLAPNSKDWQPVEHESIWYVLVKESGNLLGLFAFFPENSICFDIHVCLLPKSWGETTRRAVTLVTRWIFQNSPCQRLVGIIPVCNSLAMRLAQDSGWKIFGMNEKSYLKNGSLHDQFLFGISKDEITWA